MVSRGAIRSATPAAVTTSEPARRTARQRSSACPRIPLATRMMDPTTTTRTKMGAATYRTISGATFCLLAVVLGILSWPPAMMAGRLRSKGIPMKHCMLALLAGVSLLVISPFPAGARPLIVNTQLSPGFDQAGLQAVGVPKPIIDPSGVRLSVVVNSIQDQPSDFAPGLSPGGRWVAVNVSVTN